MALPDRTCTDCRFWKLDPQTEMNDSVNGGKIHAGPCRRNPPVISDAAARHDLGESPELNAWTIYVATRFPLVAADDWCGRHKPTPAREIAEVREYRIDAEARALANAADQAATVERGRAGVEPDAWATDPRRPLTMIDERLVNEVPHMVRDIRERAKELAKSNEARALIDWAPLDNALAECVSA